MFIPHVSTHKFLVLAAMTGLVSVPAFADEEEPHADALLIMDPSGKLVTGEYDFEDDILLGVGARVYEGEFEGPFDGIWTTDEPGFNAMSSTNPQLPAGYSALPGDAPASFNANTMGIDGQTSNLYYWDGTGEVSFAPVSGTVMEISKAPTATFSAILDGGSSPVSGFEINTTDSDGFLHQHIDFSVFNTDATDPANGFYLWSLTLTVGDSAISVPASTEPLFFVHGLGFEDEVAHEAAIDYINANLVPEPTSVGLIALGGLAMLRRRR